MPVINQTHEFDVATDEVGGILIVTDMSMMLREATEPQYHRCPYDEAYFARIMDLGDYGEVSSLINWYVLSDLPITETSRMLDRMWHAYFDGYSQGRVWINADVVYVGSHNTEPLVAGYGMCDGEREGLVMVYCREFWEQFQTATDVSQLDLRQFFETAGIIHIPAGESRPLTRVRLEYLLNRGLIPRRDMTGWFPRVIVASPAQHGPGYVAHGYELDGTGH